MLFKLPPEIKVYEAFSTLADQRFSINGQTAIVHSSNGAKSYQVKWQNSSPIAITANDNGTYYMDYAGYPILTVLMALGKIRYDAKIIHHFGKIDWNALNKSLNNDYDLAVATVMKNIADPDDRQAVVVCVADILQQVEMLQLQRLGDKEEKPPV